MYREILKTVIGKQIISKKKNKKNIRVNLIVNLLTIQLPSACITENQSIRKSLYKNYTLIMLKTDCVTREAHAVFKIVFV